MWHMIERAYAGPGSLHRTVADTDYLGHEFTDQDGVTMLYLEERC